MSALFAADEAATLLDAAIRGELPDERGRFGPFGGRYVPETLVPAFERLEDGVREYLHDPDLAALREGQDIARMDLVMGLGNDLAADPQAPGVANSCR